jgi:hypothetical protein
MRLGERSSRNPFFEAPDLIAVDENATANV